MIAPLSPVDDIDDIEASANIAKARAFTYSPPSRLQQRLRGFSAKALHVDCHVAVQEQKQVLGVDIQLEVAGQRGNAPISERYEVLEVLGQGSTGVVRRALRRSDGQEVAIKTVRTDDEEVSAIARAEHCILSSLEHPNIVQAFGFFTCVGCSVLVMEFVQGAPLDTAVRSTPKKSFEEETAKVLFSQLLLALAYLHSRRILHRDVKAENMLASPSLAKLKLVDFNVACRLSDGCLTVTGTQEWKAPEVLLGEPASELADVWSTGLCLYFMLAGRLPRQCDQFATPGEFADAVRHRPLTFSGHRWRCVSEACQMALRRCLESDKMQRPAAVTLVSDAWLAQVKGCGPKARTRRRSRGRFSTAAAGLTMAEDVLPTPHRSFETKPKAEMRVMENLPALLLSIPLGDLFAGHKRSKSLPSPARY